MKVLILGATGRTGKFLVEKALEKGYRVVCLVRNAKKLSPAENLTILEGNPIDPEDLENAINGCEILISALNISRNSDFPWSNLRTPKTYLSDVIGKLVDIAKKHSANRIIVCSAWGVLESRKDLPFWFRWMIDYSNIGIAYKDHERQEQLLEASGLDWTIVRPVGLTNTHKVQKVKETYNNMPKPSLLIGRRTVANYMVNAIENRWLFRKKVVISKLG